MYWKVGEFLGRKTDYVAYDDIYIYDISRNKGI